MMAIGTPNMGTNQGFASLQFLFARGKKEMSHTSATHANHPQQAGDLNMMMSILILLHRHMHDLLLWLWYRNVNEFLHATMLYPLMNNHLNKMESVKDKARMLDYRLGSVCSFFGDLGTLEESRALIRVA